MFDRIVIFVRHNHNTFVAYLVTNFLLSRLNFPSQSLFLIQPVSDLFC